MKKLSIVGALFFLLFFTKVAFSQSTAASPPATADSITPIPISKNRFLIVPLASKTPETNWAFGFASAYVFKTRPSDTLLRNSTILSGGLYTLNKRLILALGGTVYFPGERFVFRMENSFSHFPDKFWGLGNDTPNSAQESYQFTQFFVNPLLLYRIYRRFFIGAAFEHQSVYNFSYLPGGLFDQQNIAGRTGSHVTGIGLAFSRDSRNNAFAPDRGSLLQFTYTDFLSQLGSNYKYSYLKVDARAFIKLNKKGHVLGFHTLDILNWGDDIPIRNMAILGGQNIMRGYYAGRFKDKMAIAVQTEYRFPVWWRFGGVLFAGAGQVAPKFSEFGMNRWKPSVGTGLRLAILPKEKLNLRLDYGFGNHGNNNLYIVVSESF